MLLNEIILNRISFIIIIIEITWFITESSILLKAL